MEGIPDSILGDLSPPDLQVAVENLCKLAYEGLAKKKVVFKKSELGAAGCLGTAVELGFLSSCSNLKSISCGSAQLTNASAPVIAEVLHCLPKVSVVGIQSEMDDDGFAELEATLGKMANRLKRFKLYETKVSPALLSRMLPSLTKLALLTIVGNSIGDNGFRQVASSLRQLSALKHLHLCDIGLTWRSLAELEKILLSCPKMSKCHIFCDKKSFPPPGEDITKVPSLTTLRLMQDKTINELYVSYGYQITNSLRFVNVRHQSLNLKFFG